MATIIDTLIFDRTNANLVKGDPKGKYDYRDYNRVESTVVFLVGILTIMGYQISLTTNTHWAHENIPRANDITRYRNNVKAIVDLLSLGNSLPTTNDAVLTILGANQLEKALYDAYDVTQRMMHWFDVDDLNETWSELDAKNLKWNEYFLKARS